MLYVIICNIESAIEESISPKLSSLKASKIVEQSSVFKLVFPDTIFSIALITSLTLNWCLSSSQSSIFIGLSRVRSLSHAQQP